MDPHFMSPQILPRSLTLSKLACACLRDAQSYIPGTKAAFSSFFPGSFIRGRGMVMSYFVVCEVKVQPVPILPDQCARTQGWICWKQKQ